MTGEKFAIIYAMLAFPNIITMTLDIYDRVKNKNKPSVRVWLGLKIICFISTFIASFAFMSNWFWVKNPEMWFVNMMIVTYALMTVIIINLHNSRVVYSIEDDEAFCVARFRRKKFKISEITRINLSDKYLDIYIGDIRLRCDNIFLVGAADFENLVKECHKKRRLQK